MTIFLGGKPPTKGADAERVGYPFFSSVLRKLRLWGDSGDQNAVFKRDKKNAVPTYVFIENPAAVFKGERLYFM